jgi:threonine dehydratase
MLAGGDPGCDRWAGACEEQQEEREEHLADYRRSVVKAHAGLPVAYDDVLAARETIGDKLRRTPTFSSATLSRRIGAPVALKAELFQRTGSFKPRGMLNVVAHLSADEKQRGVITISAGNAAQSLAYCAALEGIDCLVVMWQGVSESKLAATREYGAEVDLEAPAPAEAFERLKRLQDETGRVYVHSFDDPRLIAGHGTLGFELLEDVPDLNTVVVPIGGGGLISGIATAVRGARPDTRIVGIEPELSPAMHLALEAGEPVPVEPRSIADGLNAPFAGENTLALCRALVDELVLVTEDEIYEAFRFLYERAKLACEPAGAVSTAALLAGKVELDASETTVAVVSGGNVAPRTAVAILAEE